MSDKLIYELCKHCDHFIDVNSSGGLLGVAEFMHLYSHDRDIDHDAKPSGLAGRLETWKLVAPSLFVDHSDNEIGPNSEQHRRIDRELVASALRSTIVN